jgi:hypothetical protein
MNRRPQDPDRVGADESSQNRLDHVIWGHDDPDLEYVPSGRGSS